MNKIEDPELAQFCEDLITSAKQVKAGNVRVVFSPIATIRTKLHLSQSKFSDLLVA